MRKFSGLTVKIVFLQYSFKLMDIMDLIKTDIIFTIGINGNSIFPNIVPQFWTTEFHRFDSICWHVDTRDMENLSGLVTMNYFIQFKKHFKINW